MDLYRQWSLIYNWYKDNGCITAYRSDWKQGVRVIENYNGEVVFDYSRYYDGTRSTQVDVVGIIGFSLCDFSSDFVLITEGVSDCLSCKHFMYGFNVLGKTHASVSSKQLSVVSELFNRVNIIMDNDETGYRVGMLWKRGLKGCKVKLIKPDYPYKDITEQFLDCHSRAELSYVIDKLSA